MTFDRLAYKTKVSYIPKISFSETLLCAWSNSRTSDEC